MMNKKNYIKPDMKVVKMEHYALLSGSGYEPGGEAPGHYFDDTEY